MSPYVYSSVTRRPTIKRPPRLSLVSHCLYLSTMPPSRKSAQAPFGNTLTDCAFSLIGISPPPGSPQAVPTCCDGMRCFASPQIREFHSQICNLICSKYRFNARLYGRTEVSLLLSPVIAPQRMRRCYTSSMLDRLTGSSPAARGM